MPPKKSSQQPLDNNEPEGGTKDNDHLTTGQTGLKPLGVHAKPLSGSVHQGEPSIGSGGSSNSSKKRILRKSGKTEGTAAGGEQSSTATKVSAESLAKKKKPSNPKLNEGGGGGGIPTIHTPKIGKDTTISIPSPASSVASRKSKKSLKTGSAGSIKGVQGYSPAGTPRRSLSKPKVKSLELIQKRSGQGSRLKVNSPTHSGLALLEAPPPIGFNERLFKFFKYSGGRSSGDVGQVNVVAAALCNRKTLILVVLLILLVAFIAAAIVIFEGKGDQGTGNDTTNTTAASTTVQTTGTTPKCPPPLETEPVSVGVFCYCDKNGDYNPCVDCCESYGFTGIGGFNCRQKCIGG